MIRSKIPAARGDYAGNNPEICGRSLRVTFPFRTPLSLPPLPPFLTARACANNLELASYLPLTDHRNGLLLFSKRPTEPQISLFTYLREDY